MMIKKEKLPWKGFTLAELLISSAIFITVSSVVLTALFAAFRLSKKSDALLVAKQNGNAAMSQMVRGIKYAKTLDEPLGCIPDVSTTQITITSSSDKAQTTYSCPNATLNSIASNGASLLDTRAVGVTECIFTCSKAAVHSPPRITIQFTLTAATVSGLVESKIQIPFQTSVTMRNFIR